jgi:hypothetical protein
MDRAANILALLSTGLLAGAFADFNGGKHPDSFMVGVNNGWGDDFAVACDLGFLACGDRLSRDSFRKRTDQPNNQDMVVSNAAGQLSDFA